TEAVAVGGFCRLVNAVARDMREVLHFVNPDRAIQGMMLEELVRQHYVLLVTLVTHPLDKHHRRGKRVGGVDIGCPRGGGKAIQDETVKDLFRTRIGGYYIISARAHAFRANDGAPTVYGSQQPGSG